MSPHRSRFRFLGPLARVSNLDAVFLWGMYCLSVILILWLFCNAFRTQLGFAIQQQVVSLVQTVSVFMHDEPFDGKERYAYLNVLPRQQPALKNILIVQVDGGQCRILWESSGESGKQGKALLSENPVLLSAIRKAAAQKGTTLSQWEFLEPHWNPFATQGEPGVEVICHALEADGEASSVPPPVLVLAFDTSKMFEDFRNIDRIGSIMVSLAVLIGTVLAMVARWRGLQREEAIQERLGTLDLLRQRDRILAMVAAAADDLLLSKEPKPAVQKMMDGLCQFLKLAAAYACLKPAQEPGEMPGAAASSSLGRLPPGGGLTLEELRTPPWEKTHRELLRGNYAALEAPASGPAGGFLVLFPLLSNRQLNGFVALHGESGSVLPESGVLDCLRLASDLIQSAFEKQANEKKLLHGNKMLALGRMAGGVAHEFNNLLHIISGNLRRLVNAAGSPSERDTMEKVLHASDRGARIVQQLLSATRQALPTFSASSLNAVVERTLLLGQSAFHKNIELRTHLDPAIPPTPLDEGQIQQVLLNLLINAEYAIRERGTITVTTGLTPVQAGQKGRYAFCEVRDTGEGISAEALHHMFDPFFTTKPPGSGTGLGLPTSRGILESHGGTLEGRNHPEGGAVFTFYLPLQSAISPIAPDAAPEDGPPGKIQGRIWIADDEPLCREFLRTFLSEQQLQVMDFASGDALLRHARNAASPDWIVTDWSMPGIAGPKLLKELRSRFPLTPLIVTSGFVLEPSETEEVDAVVQKPFDPAQILKLLASLRQDAPAGAAGS
jgi:signal transduction histidine kinase